VLRPDRSHHQVGDRAAACHTSSSSTTGTRDSPLDLNQTKDFIKANGWPLANTIVRRYKLHTRASAEGLVVTEYPTNRVALRAREDFYKLALELNVGGGQ
jgi:chromosome partitioning protein